MLHQRGICRPQPTVNLAVGTELQPVAAFGWYRGRILGGFVTDVHNYVLHTVLSTIMLCD